MIVHITPMIRARVALSKALDMMIVVEEQVRRGVAPEFVMRDAVEAQRLAREALGVIDGLDDGR